VLIIACLLIAVEAASLGQQAPADPALAAEGKKVFVARCAKCHDENAAKKLPDGSNLLERLGKSKEPKTRLATRISDPDELRAVAAYIAELLARH
jgi:mono/diheme cytochrome c family protein